jgi:hypothetical protein
MCDSFYQGDQQNTAIKKVKTTVVAKLLRLGGKANHDTCVKTAMKLVSFVRDYGDKTFSNCQQNRCECATEQEADIPQIKKEIQSAEKLRKILDAGVLAAKRHFNLLNTFAYPKLDMTCINCVDRNVNFTSRREALQGIDSEGDKLMSELKKHRINLGSPY